LDARVSASAPPRRLRQRIGVVAKSIERPHRLQASPAGERIEAERIEAAGKPILDVKGAHPAKATADRRDREAERQSTRGCGTREPLELVRPRRPRRREVGDDPEQELLGARAERQGGAVRPLLDVAGRHEQVMQDGKVDRRDRQHILVASRPVGVDDPQGHAEEIRERSRKADGTGEADDGTVLCRPAEQLGALWRVRDAVDDQAGAVHHSVGMHRLAAPRRGDCREQGAEGITGEIEREARGTT